MSVSSKIRTAQQILGHVFTNNDLITAAITHPSAAEGKPITACYERLEFLGDSVLGAVVATGLYTRFPDMDEGELTRMKISLVSGKTLSAVAADLGIADIIIFGESEKGTGARGLNSALENVYESLVGALYLDGGFEATRDFIYRTLGPQMTPETALAPLSPKSRLQEITQRDMRCTPTYKLESEQGPAHDPTFTSTVLVDGRRIGRGSGSSKKAAESAAALDAIARIEHGEV